MANYNQLKAAIRAVVNENHNNEITGTDLQNVLVSMINSLVGYQFVGIATPTTNPGIPDARVFYIASESGVYSNFGGIEVEEDEVVILSYNNTWNKQNAGIASLNKIREIETQMVDIDVNTGILTFRGFKFQLIRIQDNTTAICGNAICGLAICGTN